MSVVNQIKHYQQSIEKCPNNESRLLHCIEKLYKLPVTVQHLQDTGVGRTVNALRKYEGTVGDASKALVAKWKTMVVDEESSDAEDDDDQNLPDVPEPYSDNSDLGIDKTPTSSELNKGSERSFEKSAVNKHNSHSSNSKFKGNSQSEYDKKSGKSFQDSSSEKKNKNDKEKSKSMKAKEKERHGPRKEVHQDSQKIYPSDGINKEIPKPNVHLSKENKQVNGSDQNRKRKYELSNVSKIAEKRQDNNSTAHEHSRVDDKIYPKFSVDTTSVSPTRKTENLISKSRVNRKDSKREKHTDKSPLNNHEYRLDKSNKKKHSTRDNLTGSSSFVPFSSSSSASSSSPSSSSSSSSSSGSSSFSSSSSSSCTSSSSSSSSSSYSHPRTSKNKVGKFSDSAVSKSEQSKTVVKFSEEKKIKKRLNGNEGIDCNSGTTFAEALGMCSAPHVRKKSIPVSPSSPVIKIKTEVNAMVSKPNSIKTDILAKEDGLSLLGPNVKLEPLSVDLASTLPEISTNYKPLPINNYLNTLNRKMEEDKVLNDAIYAKNIRTKVYSGNKSGYTSVPSLYDLCIRVLIENIDALEATGGVPYDILKPVLERATPDQLFMLEHHNPYLIEDTDSLWQFHCNREFRNKQREEMESSREMYMRCLDEREAKLKTLTANIKQSIDKSVPVRSAKLAFVDNIVKPPRNVLRKQAKYGTARSSTITSDLKKKIITGAHSATNIAVPSPPMSRLRTSSSGIIKKNKAPLMAKALQLIKGRYKR
ncbi:transcription elongation factor B polypeptide 3 [Fopius arisanus]|uniref:Transcription elongation factor B polypeptide 3 n=1 Tax=Fopius arisanus TaxID=64838 RepID=A0A9R1T4E2_9HYME|nr:PREDICTED: transcription elongation factor B polypeptide 3 [Fopius arisanus]